MTTNFLKQNKIVLADNNENKTDAKKHTSFKHYDFVNFCKDNLPKCQEKKTLKRFNQFSEKGNID